MAALAALAVSAPATMAKPNAGDWSWLDRDAPTYVNSIQFKVTRNQRSIKGMLIFWHCGNSSGYHEFRNPPFPTSINREGKFRLTGATTPPSDQGTKDFTLRGTFRSRTEAGFSMNMERCGKVQRGTLRFAD